MGKDEVVRLVYKFSHSSHAGRVTGKYGVLCDTSTTRSAQISGCMVNGNI